jgi:endonuclease G
MSAPISYQELVQKTGIDFHLPVDGNTNKPPLISTEPIKTKAKKPLLGGWYPVFFDEYVPSKLNEIINNIKSGKVASIQIQYDQNESLAKQIAAQIDSQTNLRASSIQSSPPDSPMVTYERKRVTLIIHSK